jgi:ABC-type Fe3+-hydroxamate transport system substrate-binding protein
MEGPIIDDAGRTVALERPPRRIVSLVPSLTEVVCALGAAERLIGVTRYCTDPVEVVRRVPRVGGTKNPDISRIVALDPDLVLVNSEENRKKDFDLLHAAGLRTFVSFPRTVAEAAESIERIGLALGLADEGRRLAAEIQAALDAAAPSAPRRVFCPIWRNPWMSFNRDTYAHDVLLRAGGENVCAAESERYPNVDIDAIIAAAPEVILLPDEPFHFTERHRQELRRMSGSASIHLVDGKALSWYGPRTAAAVKYFRQKIGL